MTTRHRVPKPLRPELKDFDCSDHDPIDEWSPTESAVYYWLTLHIGEAGSDRADLYQVPICTHAGLEAWKRDRRSSAALGHPPPIVVHEYSWPAVLREVEDRVASCAGFGWLDVQEKLRRAFAWEYEGMSA